MENNKQTKKFFLLYRSSVLPAVVAWDVIARAWTLWYVTISSPGLGEKKKRASSGVAFILIKKKKRKKKCATSRVISTHREMECENRRMCVHSKGVSLWPVFLFYCVSFDWLWRGRKWNKKRIEIQATEEKAALLKAFETNDKRGTKCAKVDCFLFFKKRTLSLKHLFFYRLYNRTVSFFGRRNLNMVTRTHTYRCVTASKNNPLTIVGC